MKYNPSAVGVQGNIFGFPYLEKEANLILLPVPWDVTTSYGTGASKGPQAILNASPQLDLSVYKVKDPWSFKTVMRVPDKGLEKKSKTLRKLSEEIISELEKGSKASNIAGLKAVNDGCAEMVDFVYHESCKILDSGKLCAVLGGDHSTPLGLIRALSEREEFGILQIDAHMDLRKAYEGFTYSHASIMYNVLEQDYVKTLVQVGIRDFSDEEELFVRNSKKKLHIFYEDKLREGMMVGDSWSDWVYNMVDTLPKNVYISFDIDGLDPSLCPGTGTPVPGGLCYNEAIYLVDAVVGSGRKIVGFDLCEVCPGQGEWDANVGARVLYRLTTAMGISQGVITRK